MDKNPKTNPQMGAAAPVAKAAAQDREPGGVPNPIALLRRAICHWPVIGLTLIIGLVVTAQITRSRKPTYKSETVILFRDAGFRMSDAPAADLRVLANKCKEIMQAQSTLKRVIDDCKAYRNVVQTRGYTDAVDIMRKKVDFKARAPDTFAISYEGESREEAQRCVARLAEIMVSEDAKIRANSVKATTEFFAGETKRADEEVEKSEKELAAFMSEHPAFAGAAGGKTGILLLAEMKKDAEANKPKKKGAAAGGGRIGRRGRASADQAPAAPGAPAAPAVDPVLITARNAALTDVVNARRDFEAKSLKFTEAHPDVQAAQNRLAAAQVALQAAQDAIAAAAPPEPPKPAPAPVAAATEDPYGDPAPKAKPKPTATAAASPPDEDKDKEKDKPKPKPKDENADEQLVNLEAEWSRINRDVNAARAHAADLEGKRFKAEMIASSEAGGYGAQLMILDPAYKPGGPSGMPTKTIMIIGFVASILAGLVISAAWGLFFDDRLFHPSEVDSFEAVTLLGVVPRPKLAPKTKRRWARG